MSANLQLAFTIPAIAFCFWRLLVIQVEMQDEKETRRRQIRDAGIKWSKLKRK